MKKKKQNDEAPLPAREAALRILERTGISAPVQSLLDTKLTGGLFSRQEAALTTELVYGYLRSEIRISWLLSQFMKAPEKLPASMKLMIGIAAYELLYLDRIPAHASVSAAVDAVRARFGQGLSRVANGVLRSLIRLSESEDLKAFAFYESRIKDPMERLSVFHSVPRWMLELWTKGYGPEKAETFARAVSVVPSPCVRVNAARDEWEALRLPVQGRRSCRNFGSPLRARHPAGVYAGLPAAGQAVDTGRGKPARPGSAGRAALGRPRVGRLRRTRRQDARAR